MRGNEIVGPQPFLPQTINGLMLTKLILLFLPDDKAKKQNGLKDPLIFIHLRHSFIHHLCRENNDSQCFVSYKHIQGRIINKNNINTTRNIFVSVYL